MGPTLCTALRSAFKKNYQPIGSMGRRYIIYLYTWTFQFGCQMVPFQGVNSASLRVSLAPLRRGCYEFTIKKSPIDGSVNMPFITWILLLMEEIQLTSWCGNYPIIYDGFYTSQKVVVWDFLHQQYQYTRLWFQTFAYIYTYLGKWSNLTYNFQIGWNHQLLLMEEILHHLGWLKPYKEWDNHHPLWCRIFSINSSIPPPWFCLLRSFYSIKFVWLQISKACKAGSPELFSAWPRGRHTRNQPKCWQKEPWTSEIMWTYWWSVVVFFSAVSCIVVWFLFHYFMYDRMISYDITEVFV